MLSIRILLANHQPIIRSGLRLLLEREPDFRIVAEAANGREAVVLTDFKHPEVVILDVKLPYLNGIGVAREISSKEGSPKSIFVTTDTDESYVFEAFKAGARGYVAADSAPADLARAIHVVVGGHLFLSPTICIRCLDGHVSTRDLPEYQKQLWCLLAAGYSQTEIATQLNVDVNKLEIDCKTIHNTVHCDALQNSIANSVFSVK
ncbi:MAG: response regulator transcription factor [Acidobacteriota bacterium]|nr:response regulator transcription factor [Acidobacteriota bacterium]